MRDYLRPSLSSRALLFSGDPVPDAPQIVISASSIAEDASINDVVGILSVAHSEDVFTFTITADPDSKFQIANDDELQLSATLDYETATSHNVTIEADNGVDDPITWVFTINVTNVAESEDGPAILALSPLDNATGVAIDATLSVQFDVPIEFGATVLIRLYKSSGDVLVQEWTEADIIGVTVDGDTLEILPDSLLEYEVGYYVTIAAGSVENAGGDPFVGIAGSTAWSFTAAAEVVEDTVPDAFEVGDWSVAAGDEEADVTISSLPADGGDTITDVEYRLDGGSWVSSGGTTSFTITGLTNDQEYDVELRAVNGVGNGAASDVKAVTPEAAGYTFVNAEAAAVAAAFSTPPSDARAEIIDDLVGALKGHSLWAKLDWLAVFAAADSQAALINWKSPGTLNPTLVNTPTFTADEGFAGNGSSSYIASGFIPGTHGSNFTQNAASYGVYNRTSRTSGAATQIMGSVGAGPSDINSIVPKWSDNNFYYDITHGSGPNGSVGAFSNAQGLLIASRTASNVVEAYKNGSSINTGSSVSAALAGSTAFHIGARNNNGTPDRFSTDQVAAAFIGGSLNDTEAANLSTDINAYMTALGKNVY